MPIWIQKGEGYVTENGYRQLQKNGKGGGGQQNA